ncbi:hypothetical protein [Paraburkholderia sp. GAS448]|uniref:hypothetical protein n=1 Tax=Paraburkholderia sp. GAS448 TaxID=3035136 RepID=UPI003D1B3C4D
MNIPLDFLESFLKETGCRWRAASTLHFHLLEAGSKAPKWRNWLATGMAVRLDAEDQHRAMMVVERIACDDEGFLLAHLEGRLEPNLKEPAGMPPLFDPAEAQWVKHLGFERNELFAFLNREGIAHDLLRLPEDSLHPVTAGTDLQSDGDPGPKVRRIKQRRDLLEPAIDQAITDANGSMETADVWLRLKQLALDEFPPFTTTISKNGGLEYNDHDSSGRPCINSISKDALGARLRRRKDGATSRKRAGGDVA